MPVLLKFEKDCSDEFDVHGFSIISNKTWEQYQKMFKCLNYPVDMNFGTNEMLVFEDSLDLTEATTVMELTIPEEKMLIKLFKHSYQGETDDTEFGWVPYSNLVDELNNEDYKRIFENGNE